MPQTDKRIDAYILKSSVFAIPILEHLRTLVHKACPEAVETIKWGMPHFEYKDAILCGMASFKQHCAFNFWKASIMDDPKGILETRGKTSMGHFGKIQSLGDLPPDKTIISYIKEAMKLNEQGVIVPKAKPAGKKELIVPDYFTKELKKNKKALKTFNDFSYSNKKEYIEWITGAKTEATCDSRMATAIEWMAEGKIRHWKHVK